VSAPVSTIREAAAEYAALPDSELLAAAGLSGYAGRLATGDVLSAHGLPPRTHKRLAAVVAFVQRLAVGDLPTGDLLSHPEAVVRYIALHHGHPSQEIMGALYLDIRSRLLRDVELFRGTIARAAVEPRALFEAALACRASGILLYHNHPSGDPCPSADDLVFTRRLADAGEVMGIRLVDHLVIGSANRWVSLRRQGGW
jgi:DNA repair protein RadC